MSKERKLEEVLAEVITRSIYFVGTYLATSILLLRVVFGPNWIAAVLGGEIPWSPTILLLPLELPLLAAIVGPKIYPGTNAVHIVLKRICGKSKRL